MSTGAQGVRERDRGVKLALVLAFAAVLAPILMTANPPLLDYPNHLARFWLLAGGDHVAPVSGMYRIDWSRASTNIGIDLIVAALGKLLPYQVIGKLVVIAALAGPSAGAALLNRLVFGRWHWWQLSLPILAWTTTALFGFMSYQVAMAAALFFACLEPVLKGRPILATAVRLACATIALLFHPFGVVFYGALITALAIGPEWRGLACWGGLLRVLRSAAGSGLVVLVPCLLLYVLAATPPGDHIPGRPSVGWMTWSLYNLVLTAASPFASYRLWLDALFVLPLLAIGVWAAWKRRLNAHAGLFIVALVTALLALVMPGSIGDAGWLTRRLPLMAALMLFASVQPEPAARAVVRVALMGLVLAIDIGKSAWIATVWQAREHEVRSIERALSAAPAGSAVFAVQIMPKTVGLAPVGRYLAGIPENSSESTLRHFPALVVPERHAFIPTLFSVAGQQPLRILPPWRDIAVPSSWVPDAHVLDGHPSPGDLRADPYLADWPHHFDYVLVIGADLPDQYGPFQPPAALRQVAGDGYAKLFRVQRRPASGAPLAISG